MTVEISVGPPVLTINHGNTFMVTEQSGEITANSEQGLFASDTRFVSYYSISADGEPWTRVTSSTPTYYGSRIYLTNSDLITEKGPVPAGSLSLIVSRAMAEGVHEDLDLVNYSLKPIGFNLEIAIRADFADLFEVKSHRPIRRGRIETEWDSNAGELRTSYSNREFHRCLIYRIGSDAHADYANGRITLPIELQPGASWHVCCEYLLGEGGNLKNPERSCLLKTEETRFDRLQHEWLEQATVRVDALVIVHDDGVALREARGRRVVDEVHGEVERSIEGADARRRKERPRGVAGGYVERTRRPTTKQMRPRASAKRALVAQG